MNVEALIDSFIAILQCVSLDDTLVSPDDPLGVVVSEQYVDDLDFELAVACFEATHRVSLDYHDLADEDIVNLTIRELITRYLVTEGKEMSDPLFITKRFLMFKEALVDAIDRDSDE